MKENSPRKIFNPFKDILSNDLVTKAKSGITDLVSGVKNLFRSEAPPQEAEVNNYLKSPDEMEAELRFISTQKEKDPVKNEFNQQDSGASSIIQKQQMKPANFHPLEEALAGEMEENY